MPISVKCHIFVCNNIKYFDMKGITILLSAMFISGISYSQSTTPEVISSAGDHFENSNLSISWTIGEPIIETQSAGTATITQGFHQGLYTIISVEEQIEQPIVNIYPNPTTDFVNVEIKGQDAENFQIQLYDELGKVLVNKKYTDIQQINLSQYAKATYFLKVVDTKNETYNSYKILKK